MSWCGINDICVWGYKRMKDLMKALQFFWILCGTVLGLRSGVSFVEYYGLSSNFQWMCDVVGYNNTEGEDE